MIVRRSKDLVDWRHNRALDAPKLLEGQTNRISDLITLLGEVSIQYGIALCLGACHLYKHHALSHCKCVCVYRYRGAVGRREAAPTTLHARKLDIFPVSATAC